MNAHFSPAEPDKIRFTLTATMSLAEWKEIKSALNPSINYPPVESLYYAILDVVTQAEERFSSYPPPNDQQRASQKSSEPRPLEVVGTCEVCGKAIFESEGTPYNGRIAHQTCVRQPNPL